MKKNIYLHKSDLNNAKNHNSETMIRSKSLVIENYTYNNNKYPPDVIVKNSTDYRDAEIENIFRNKSPFINGKRNSNYVAPHFKSQLFDHEGKNYKQEDFLNKDSANNFKLENLSNENFSGNFVLIKLKEDYNKTKVLEKFTKTQNALVNSNSFKYFNQENHDKKVYYEKYVE